MYLDSEDMHTPLIKKRYAYKMYIFDTPREFDAQPPAATPRTAPRVLLPLRYRSHTIARPRRYCQRTARRPPRYLHWLAGIPPRY